MLLVAVGVLVVTPPPSAEAITATNGSGYPGDVVTIRISNQRAQGRVTWPINAPAQTTFDAVPQSANPPGTQPFVCPLAGPTQAVCGPPASSWAAGNQVVAQLRIKPDAPAGNYTGSTAVGNEFTQFVVQVLPPPAPPVASPGADSVISDRSPTISGSRRAGNAVTVSVDGAGVCTIAAEPDTAWSCPTGGSLDFGSHTLTATQTSPGGDTSDATTVSFTVIDDLTITTPGDGVRTTDRTPGISGAGALPGAEVTATVDGQTLTATAGDDGTWTVTPAMVAIGPQTVTASWRVGGQRFDATPVSVTVVPGPLVIDAPADGSRTFNRRPAITGSGAEPGARITLLIDSQSLTTTADDVGAWSVDPAGNLEFGRHPVVASQTVNETTSEETTSAFTVAQLEPPTITSPAAGSRTTNRRPTLSGTAEPDAKVTVRVGGRTLTTRADRTGRWQTSTMLALGGQSISATETVDTVTSAASRRAFTIYAPPPPVTNPPAAAPGGTGDRAGVDTSGGSGDTVRSGGVADAPAAATAPDRSRRTRSSKAPKNGTDSPHQSSAALEPGSGSEPVPDPNSYLPVQLSLAAATITPGRVSSFVGTLGPIAATKPVTVTLSGTMNRGMLYRSVDSDPAGTCTVTNLQFTCIITLQPGQRAVLQVRVLADALNAPAYARQQLSVSVPGDALPNTSTQTTRINRPTEVSTLAAAISRGPGNFLILLVLFMFALAATEYERRHPRT